MYVRPIYSDYTYVCCLLCVVNKTVMFSAICIHSMPTLRESLKSFMFPQINCTFWVRVFQMPFSNNFFSNKKNHTLQQPIALINKPSTGKKDVISEITTCRDGFRMANVWFAVLKIDSRRCSVQAGGLFLDSPSTKASKFPTSLYLHRLVLISQ